MLLLIGAIVLLLLILLLVIKRILGHRAAAVEDGVEDAGHMEAVYRRVAEEERKVEAAMGAAVAAAMTEPEIEAAAEVPETEAAAEVEAEPEVKVKPEAEAEPETSEIPEAAGPEADKVVLEGEHSRLIYDPETGEYKLEFK